MKRNLSLLIAIIFMTSSFLTAEKLKDHVAALLKDAPAPGKNGLIKKVPYRILDAKLGFFGLFAIFKFEDQTRLGILNIAQGKFQKMIRLKSKNYEFATGSTLLVIYYPETNTVELWDLLTMKKIKKQKILLDNGYLTTLLMAPALKSKVLASAFVGKSLAARRFFGILNLKTLQFTKFKDNNLFNASLYKHRIHLRCNKKMTKVLSWRSSQTPSGFNYISLRGTHITSKYEQSSFGSLNFANNDNFVLTTNGSILSTDAKVLKKYPKSMLFPVLGDDFYIQYKLRYMEGEPNVIVRDLNSHKEVTALTTEVKLKKTPEITTDFTVDRKLMASKLSDRIVIIDNNNRKVRIYALGISGNGNSLGSIPTAFVGRKWIYKLKYPKGTKVVIEDGPKNMIFNPVSNRLIWNRPGKKEIQTVLLGITKPGEEEFYKEIKIIVKKK